MELFGVHHVDGELQAGPDVLQREVWVVIADDLGKRDIVADQLQDGMYRNPCPGNTGVTKVDVVTDFDTWLHGVLGEQDLINQ
ncbi:MAG TPA: hypothetical protein VGA17_13420, partial [Nitrospiraceae bacterium]